MNCPNCGAPMLLEEGKAHLWCDHCGTRHFPEPNADGVRLLGQPAGACCPVCQQNLVHAVIAGYRLLYCETCRGLLVPMDVFVALLQSLRSRPGRHPAPPRSLPWKDLNRELHCPLCHEPMDTHPYAGPGNVIIDSCSRCRVNWLDHSELHRIASAPGRDAGAFAWQTP